MKRPPAAVYSLPLLALLVLAFPLASRAQADTGNAARPLVEVNFSALSTTASGVRAPTRIIDGNTVITLTPPELRPQKPSVSRGSLLQKTAAPIVTPKVKPTLSLPETDVAATPAIPVPPVNPAKLPDTAGETKFEDVPTPVVKMDTAPIPTPEVVEKLKTEVAQSAAEKVSETAEAPPASAEADSTAETTAETVTENAAETAPETESAVQPEADTAEEIKLAAIAPDAGPSANRPIMDIAETNDSLTRILFPEGEMELPETAQSDLKAIAEQVMQEERQNVQLLAYGSGDNVSAARRLSLSRALAVRSELMALGVDNRSIEVRALGEPEGNGPADRVDLLLITR